MASPSDYIHEIVPLTPAEKEAVENAFTELPLSKGECWIQQGKVCEHVAYVVEGTLRVFYRNDSGNEVTCFFVTADHFISPI